METETGIIISVIGIIVLLFGAILSYGELPILIQKLRTKRTYEILEKIKFWTLSKSKIVGIILIISGSCIAILGLLI